MPGLWALTWSIQMGVYLRDEWTELGPRWCDHVSRMYDQARTKHVFWGGKNSSHLDIVVCFLLVQSVCVCMCASMRLGPCDSCMCVFVNMREFLIIQKQTEYETRKNHSNQTQGRY